MGCWCVFLLFGLGWGLLVVLVVSSKGYPFLDCGLLEFLLFWLVGVVWCEYYLREVFGW